jgi:L-alanine-DL-glutamate epimerase-like enolase superfamily enzyme
MSSENFLAIEYHSADCEWWDDLVVGRDKPIVDHGWITVDDKPGLGIDDLNDEVIAEHLHHAYPGVWESTDEWNNEWSHDRLWS